MTLTIVGRDPRDHTVWVDVDGETFPLPPYELASMRSEVMARPYAKRGGHTFDEQDITELLQAMTRGVDLVDCRCGGDVAVFVVEGAWVCAACALAYSDAENGFDEAVRGA